VSNGAQGATVHLAGQTAAPAPGSDEPQVPPMSYKPETLLLAPEPESDPYEPRDP